MNSEERLRPFVALGQKIDSIDNDELKSLCHRAANQNPWFTPESILTALTGVSKLVSEQALSNWVSRYDWDAEITPRTVGLILPGNIPLVGFHDILSVLISGHKALVKPSKKDAVMIDYVAKALIGIEPRIRERLSFAETLKHFDAVIATGSDNSARYFEYYFGKYPSIIRKNRTSCAVLSGSESEEQMVALGKDVFSYFGLGCRNVSKLFVPQDYDFAPLLKAWTRYSSVIHHHKYCNNYDHQKAILIVNKSSFLDNGHVLLAPSEQLVSPIAMVYYEEYLSSEDLLRRIHRIQEKIQCIIGDSTPAQVSFGEAQSPGPGDYADRVDTLQFLIDLA